MSIADLVHRERVERRLTQITDDAGAEIERMIDGMGAVTQLTAQLGENATRAAHRLTAFAAGMQGKRWICVTEADGRTRVRVLP